MKKNKNILILHIPHSSRKLPNEFFSVCTLTKKELNFYLNKMTDNFTYELFGKNSHKKVAAKFSRLYCDVERFCQESKEPMEKLGMGMIYTKTFDGKNLSIPTEKYKEKIKKQYYEKYHEKFDKLIFKNKNKNIIIIDCHSFSNEMAKLTQNVQECPDICLGFDKEFSDNEFNKFTKSYFEKFGYNVRFNFPYQGSFVPNFAYKNKRPNVVSLMIEVNKRLYMDEQSFTKNQNFSALQKQIKTFFKFCQHFQFSRN